MFIIFILGFLHRVDRDFIHRRAAVLPIFVAANVDMVWLATLICVNLQTSFLTRLSAGRSSSCAVWRPRR